MSNPLNLSFGTTSGSSAFSNANSGGTNNEMMTNNIGNMNIRNMDDNLGSSMSTAVYGDSTTRDIQLCADMGTPTNARYDFPSNNLALSPKSSPKKMSQVRKDNNKYEETSGTTFTKNTRSPKKSAAQKRKENFKNANENPQIPKPPNNILNVQDDPTFEQLAMLAGLYSGAAGDFIIYGPFALESRKDEKSGWISKTVLWKLVSDGSRVFLGNRKHDRYVDGASLWNTDELILNNKNGSIAKYQKTKSLMYIPASSHETLPSSMIDDSSNASKKTGSKDSIMSTKPAPALLSPEEAVVKELTESMGASGAYAGSVNKTSVFVDKIKNMVAGFFKATGEFVARKAMHTGPLLDIFGEMTKDLGYKDKTAFVMAIMSKAWTEVVNGAGDDDADDDENENLHMPTDEMRKYIDRAEKMVKLLSHAAADKWKQLDWSTQDSHHDKDNNVKIFTGVPDIDPDAPEVVFAITGTETKEQWAINCEANVMRVTPRPDRKGFMYVHKGGWTAADKMYKDPRNKAITLLKDQIKQHKAKFDGAVSAGNSPPPPLVVEAGGHSQGGIFVKYILGKCKADFPGPYFLVRFTNFGAPPSTKLYNTLFTVDALNVVNDEDLVPSTTRKSLAEYMGVKLPDKEDKIDLDAEEKVLRITSLHNEIIHHGKKKPITARKIFGVTDHFLSAYRKSVQTAKRRYERDLQMQDFIATQHHEAVSAMLPS